MIAEDGGRDTEVLMVYSIPSPQQNVVTSVR